VCRKQGQNYGAKPRTSHIESVKVGLTQGDLLILNGFLTKYTQSVFSNYSGSERLSSVWSALVR
jgi:hypothetical protein